MQEINPYIFTNNLLDTFRKYLLSLVPINDPDIHKLYADALSDGNYKIFKGPFIHCPPQYKKSSTPRELMNSKKAPFLDNRFLLCNPNSFDPDLSLYTHQVEALKRIQEGRNVVISTGTGSGKTEGFLYPILHDALQNPSHGVRSVVIYPMNALANDQLERLRNLLDTNQDITFGRYTGETLDNRDEVAKTDTHNPMLPNERLSREDIRSRPPHILLTNFAMLEYLLLRPVDSDIFSQKKVKYIILDEAHTYTGAQGIDISMLLRRFSSRFKNNNIQFILTSATISENIKDVARFASDLCGVEFHDEDIITGNEQHKFKPRTIPTEQLNNHKDQFNDESSLDTWCEAFDNESALKDMLKLSKLFPDYSEDEPVYKTLYKNLQHNEVLYKIFMLCREKPLTIDEIANEIYGSVDVASRNSVAWFLMVGAHARQTRESAPLMQVKFHYFLRGLTGSSICINKDCSGMNSTSSSFIGKALFLEERERCNLCNSKVFQLSCCTHCGMPAFKVYIQDNKWQIVKPGGNPVAEVLSIGVHGDDVEMDNVPDAGSHMNRKLCLNCGYFSEEDELYDCCDDVNVISLRALGSDENGDIRTCPQCSGRAGKFDSALRTFRTGDEAPTSVIAESILRELPIINRDKPAGARSLIAFSDSRQRAAFFAPYLSRTVLDMAFRQPLVDAMIAAAKSIDGELAPLDDIAERYVSAVSKAPYIITKNIDFGIETYEVKSSKDITSSVRSRMMKSIKAELIRQVCMSPRHKNGFYGLAFAYPIIDFTESDEEKAQERIPDLFNSFNFTDSFILLQTLLKLFLRRMAIEIPEDIPPDMIMEHVEYARFHRSNSGEDGKRKISRWNPYSAPDNERRNAINRSAQLKILKKVFPDESYNDSFYDKLLGNIWDFFIDSVLTDCDRGEYQLKYDRLLFSLKGAWHVCITCGTYAPYSLNGVCLHSDCSGKLRCIKDDEFKVIRKNNHVYNRVFNKKPLPIKVKEHTAQLTNTTGRKYQDEFRDGDINVLSTSTTFELGIDIGRLKCVFLRNIPPTINSYIQRSGRAGRRLDGTSFVVTFARNSPHDQFYFQYPEKFMGSKLQPPIINMRNDKLIQRHVNSFLLGKFLLTHFSKIPSGHLTIKWFFGYSDNPFYDIDRQNSPYVQFRHWLESGVKMLRVDVLEFLPLGSPLAQGHIDPLKNSLEEMGRVRATADDEVKRYSRHYAELQGQVSGAQSSSIENIGKSLKVLERLDSQFKKQKLINYLSSTSWLPSYAFPQDIVKLRVLQDKYADKMKLDRDREYGIAEYAPGATIIADGKLFESKGLVFFGQEPEIKQYRFCTDCRILYTHSEFEEKKECDSCGKRLTGRQYSGKYIEPLGFTTAFNDPVKAPDLHRRLPPPNTDIFLLEGTPEEQFKSFSDIKGVSYGFYSDGKLFKANRGYKAAGFQICKKCGILLNTGSRSHKSPWGSSCQGNKIHIHLAHEFTTEILQLRFTSAPERWDVGFWFSLSEVLKNSIAETLDVARRDIGVTFRGISESSGRGEIVIFDRVPGSAGYLQHVIHRLSDILRCVQDTLTNCTCDIESSCYACLRSYDNQFHWEHLKRKTLIQWIEKLI